jgi:hypothetical protein
MFSSRQACADRACSFFGKEGFFWLIPEHLFLDKINYTHHTRKPGDICRVTASQPAQEDRK